MSTGNVLCGVLFGVAAGLAIGFLTAPDSGEETRKKIKNSARRVKRILGKGADGLSELRYIIENEVTGMKDDVKERILTLIDEAIETYQNFKKEAV